MNTKIIVATLTVTVAISAAMFGASAIAQGTGQHGMSAGHERPDFQTLDSDGDGSLTVAEARAHFNAKFSAEDSDGDGSLSVEEMKVAAAKRDAKHSDRIVARMIEWRDTDGDGKLTQSELGGNMLERMFTHLDADEDGVISQDEFAQMEMRGPRGGGHSRQEHGKSGMGGHKKPHSGGHDHRSEG